MNSFSRRFGLKSLVIHRSVSTHLIPRAPITIEDDLSFTHSKLFDISLQSYLPNLKSSASHVLPGSHLIFFNHAVPEKELAPDGYDVLQSPLGVQNMIRRWVSGRLDFMSQAPLKLGALAFCYETIDEESTYASGKHNPLTDIDRPTNTEKVAVTISRKLEQDGDLKIREMRKLSYYTLSPRLLRAMKKVAKGQRNTFNDPPHYSQDINATEILIFRFSALTFNAHKIHFESQYAYTQEGLSAVITQGPLLVSLMLRWASSTFCSKVRTFDYKILGSISAGDDFKMCASKISDDQYHMFITVKEGDLVVFDAHLTVDSR